MIELKNISKKFKDNYVLKDINLIFQEGNIYGIYGRNGSGKTLAAQWSWITGCTTPLETATRARRKSRNP